MKKQYFAWKDGKQANGTEQEWVELSPSDYRQIYENNKQHDVDKRRYFLPLPGLEDGDVYYLFECDYEQYKKYRAEKERQARKENGIRNDDIKYGKIKLLSLDAEFSDEMGESFTMHEVIVDKTTCFEDKLVISLSLSSALEHLTESEKEIVYALFLNEQPVSERYFGVQTGVPQKTLNNRKIKILNTLKKYLAQN